MRILVIDDDADMRQVLVQLLADAGYEAVDASDGKEGIRIFRETPFDLIITDLLMPEKDGLEVIMELRRDFPEVKIITFSGGDQYGNSPLNTSIALGAARMLRKPFSREQMLEAVREVLESK